MKRLSKILIVLIVSISLAACSNKAQTGAAIVAAVGTGIGIVFGHGKNKEAIAALSALIGGMIGYGIGASLDQRDQQALKEKTKEAIRHARVNEKVKWKSDHSKATAEIKTISEKITTKKTIVPVYIQKAKGQGVTTVRLNVRSGPKTSFNVVRTLAQGQEVAIVGIAENGWYKIRVGNSLSGFVNSKYLRKKSEKTASVVPKSTVEPTEQAAKSIKKERKNNVEPIVVSRNKHREEISAVIKTKCRTVVVRIKDEYGSIKQDQFETCQDESGSWGA